MSLKIETDIGFLCSGDMVICSKKLRGKTDQEIVKALRKMERVANDPGFQWLHSSGCRDSYESIEAFLDRRPMPRQIFNVDHAGDRLRKLRSEFNGKRSR